MQFKLDVNRRNVPSELYLNDLRFVADRVGKRSVTGKEYSDFGTYDPSSLRKRFGSWAKVLVAAGLSVEHHNEGVRLDDALADLRLVAEQLQKTSLTKAEYSKHGRYSPAPLFRHFGSWLKALEAAGLQPSRNYGISDESLFANLEMIWTTLGRQPKYSEIAKPFSSYSTGTYEQRFGSWRKALEAFVEYINLAPEIQEETDELPAPAIRSQHSVRRKTPRSINWRLRFLVMRRDEFRCRLCGASQSATTRLDVDHILPWSKGGDTVFENLQTCCERCNIGKSDLHISGQSAGPTLET